MYHAHFDATEVRSAAASDGRGELRTVVLAKRRSALDLRTADRVLDASCRELSAIHSRDVKRKSHIRLAPVHPRGSIAASDALDV